MLALVFVSNAEATGLFEPKVQDVCSSIALNPKLLVLDARKLVAQLLEKNAGISAIDLDGTGNGVVYPQTARLLLDPGLCGNKCGKDISTKLGEAFITLSSYIQRHASPIDASKGGINTTELSDLQTLKSFLLGNHPPRISCALAQSDLVAPSGKSAGGTKKDDSKPDASAIPQYFSLRQNVEDLPIPQDSNKFKGLKQASVAYTQDRVATKSSFSIDLAAGYTIGRLALDETGNYVGQITPFFTYNQQFVDTATPAKNTRVQNLGFGLLGDLTFPTGIGGGFQNIQVYPKYVTSLRTDAEVLSGNFVYTPMYGISGIDSVYYLAPDLLSFKLTPQLKFVINDVIDAGTDAGLLKTGSYYWIGPRFDLTFLGEGTFDGFTYNVAYETYDVIRGNIKRVSLFQTALNYDFGKTKLMSLQLKYQKGRNLDTLESIDQLTLGLGVKY